MPATYSTMARGGSALRGDSAKRCLRASEVKRSGTPLVCCSSWLSLTPFQSGLKSGSHLPSVSSSDRTPSSTSDSATAPLKALATLAMRM